MTHLELHANHQTYLIDHAVVLSCFNHRLHPVRSIMTTLFRFQHRLHLFDRSCRCPVWFSSQTTVGLIDHENPISFLSQIAPIQLITLLFCLVFLTNHTRSDRFRQFSFSFGIDRTQSDRSRQLSFIFGIDYTCMIDHVAVLSGFHHRPHTIRQVPTIHFRFQCGPVLYDRSCHCHVWFSSQIGHDLINHDNSISFLTQIAFV